MSSFTPPLLLITPETPGAVIINPIQQRTKDGETPEANVGTGQKALITTPDSSSTNPVAINVTDNVSDGFVGVAAATQKANIVILGVRDAANAASIRIGLGANSDGDTQSNAGSTVQVADYYKGDVIVNYDGAIPEDGVKVDLSTQTVGNSTAGNPDTSTGTIAQNAPSYLTKDSFNAPDFYIQTGAGNDNIKGSRANDFIRAGDGDDIINGGAGNDIIRAGSGSDTVTLGPGRDVYYLTSDQFLTPDSEASDTRDVLTDFNPAEDSVQLDAKLEGKITITGLGTSELTITYNESDPVSTLVLVSANGSQFGTDVVQFV